MASGNIFKVNKVQREAAIEKKSKEEAKKIGWASFKFVSPGHNGVPDQMFIKSGVVAFIEYKTAVGRLSKLQEICINDLKNMGCLVFVARSPKETIDILTNIDNSLGRK